MEGKKIYFLLVVCVIIIFSGCVISIVLTDREAPEIIVSEAGMIDQYTDDMDVTELLRGVTAYDQHDGDVTDSLSVVNLIVLGDGQTIQVTYAAKDKKNNVTQKNVKISYAGDKSFINISSAEGDTTTVEESDKNDENDTTAPEETSETDTLPKEEETTEPSVTEGGSGTPVKIDKAAVDASGIPQIELKYTDYTIHLGEKFSTLEALDMVNDTYDDSEPVSNRIVISGLEDIDTNTKGDYVLGYSVSDTKGNKSEVQKLTLHIID